MYFTGRFRYRKAGVLGGGLLALAFGVMPIVLLAPDLFRMQWSWGVAVGALWVSVVSVLMLFTGFKLLRRWFVGTTLDLEVSAVGVSYGERHLAWQEIQWIGGDAKHGRVQLILKRKGTAPKLPLLVDAPLTVDRYDALMQELSAALREKHPHVAVG